MPNASRARIAIFAAASRPLDVVGRVGLGVAEPLGLAPAPRRRSSPLRAISREDEVGRAVDDPVDALDARARERLAAAPGSTGTTPATARLEAQLHAALAGGVEQLLAVLREQLLVGGDDVPAGRAARRAT